MRINLLSLLLLMAFFIPAFAQSEGQELQILEDGEEVQLPDSLQSKIDTDSTIIQQTLLQWYAARGFLNAEINSLSSTRADIERGCQFKLEELFVRDSGEMDSVFIIGNRGDYSQAKLEREIRALILDLEEQGYPFAKSRIAEFNPDFTNCSVSVSLEIETGNNITSQNIYFTGAASNSQEYLRRVSRFRESALVTPDYLRGLKSNLSSSELFSYVEDARIFMRDGEPVIVFDVEERALNQFDGLLGYVPDAEGEGQVIGNVELSLWNVLTQGNGFNFRYQRLKPEVSKLNLEVSQDWIGNFPVGVSAGFQLHQNDTTYQSRDFDLNGYYLMSSGFRLTGGVGFQATTSGTNVPQVVEPDGRKQIGRLGFEYSNLDSYDVPTAGNSIMVNFSVANKNLEDDSLASFIQNTLQFQVRNYLSIFQKSVIATSFNGFFLDADRVTINDLFQFGGANSFRGYAEEQFRAGTMLWGDLEYRFLLNRYSYLFAFGAAGGYERPRLLTESDNTFQAIDYLFSTGFGLSYRTQIGRLTFTYAVSPEESIGNGKIHFGIRTSL
ncbi:MAG: BamA/TamA family outer membrane protein [Balneolaceae bacterium]